jgi:hypothetical protein
MHGARVEFEIAPSRSSVATFDIGTVESEEDEGFFHHVFRLEKDVEFGVFVRDRVGRVGRKVGVGRGGEDDRRLGLLSERDGDGESNRQHARRATRNGTDSPCKTYTRVSCTTLAAATHTRGTSDGCTRTGNST